jgi:hypothetical protein
LLSKTFDIQAELNHILESRWLRESAQMRSLLRHVVEETLAGRKDGLKEYSLGLAVFHRPPDYDPRNDAIVRVQASQLRKRLASYYEHEGRSSTLRIEMPRGAYVPVFSEVEAEFPPPVVQPPKPAPPPSATRWRLFSAGVTVGALLALGGFLLSGWRQAQPAAYAPALWGAFIGSSDETIVSFGVPLFYTGAGGFYVRDTAVNVPEQQHRGRIDEVARALGSPVYPQEDIYTGIGDMLGTNEVVRWLELHSVKTSVANSHYLGHTDILGKNLVVVSSIRFQTLLQEMQLPSRFTFEGTSGTGFLLQDPGPGEQRHYPAMTGAGVDTSYALLHLWPGKRPEHRILYVTGITTWATQGAAQYAVSPQKTADLQDRLDADPPDSPRGRKSPFFEVLLRIEGKNNQVRTATYVTHRYLYLPQPPRPPDSR